GTRRRIQFRRSRRGRRSWYRRDGAMKCLLHFDPGPRLRGVIARRLAPSPMVVVPEDDEEALYREIGDTSILLHVLAPVDAALMRRAPQLRLVQKVGVGVDAIDLEAARQRGIAVCNMPGTNSQAVAELTLLLMLATLDRKSTRLNSSHV